MDPSIFFAAIAVVSFVIGLLFGRGDSISYYRRGVEDGANTALSMVSEGLKAYEKDKPRNKEE